ncbi:MAG TPA: 1-deoxy-D-xylulose-5-phosphate synthase N-terminal domain-containing protein [Gaiellaceae bacterium]|nr:1-deoxy-D-xylulose-5-phosphate synthase N-terminal domain-containing protein [Gaiellaceae bacterium]
MSLGYVPLQELERIRALDADPVARAAALADACRINTLTMVAYAGSGHIGTSFSCLDIITWLHLGVLGDDDRYFSSKGHDAPALYSLFIALGRVEFEKLFTLRRLGGLPGHPDVRTMPQVTTNTGSLGMGVSKARGFVLADRLAGRTGRVFVLTGDGELQEGQFWESLQPTANRSRGELTVIVDHNKLQSDTWVSHVSDLGDLEAKVASFGWATRRVDGHDLAAFSSTLDELLQTEPSRPKLIVADTVKGCGVSFMEPHDVPQEETSLYGFHSGAPKPADYARGLEELVARLNAKLAALGAGEVRLEQRDAPVRTAPEQPQRLIQAYGEALASAAEREERLVALDADLRLDTGLVEFQKRFPARFFECGIAEMDMVSQAGAMALAGLIPACHSFACFMVPRAAEQVFNNASEGTKVLYHGSLVGLVPGGPGHSHQMVRDIALMGSVPGMSAVEPYCEDEARRLVAWAVEQAEGPVYIRLVSPPWPLGFEPPAAELEPGRGTVLREGEAGTFVCTGPVLVSQAWAACEQLEGWGVVALPWLRDIDGEWLAQNAPGSIVCLDNHVIPGGQGEAVLRALAESAPEAASRVTLIGVDRVPECGLNDEVLHAHGLDASSLAARVQSLVTAA